MPKDTEQITVTLPLETLIHCILGDSKDGLSNSIILPEVAEILMWKIPPNSLMWKITHEPSRENPMRLVPVLWRYQSWAESNSLRDKQKAWQEKVITEGWIRDTNVDLIAQRISEQSGMRIDDARNIAYGIIKGGTEKVGEALRVIFGIEKLITKKEEL